MFHAVIKPWKAAQTSAIIEEHQPKFTENPSTQHLEEPHNTPPPLARLKIPLAAPSQLALTNVDGNCVQPIKISCFGNKES